MQRIKIITDSTAYFNMKEIKEFNIGSIPLNYTINNVTKEECYTENFDYLYQNNVTKQVSTSQPPVGLILDAFEKALEQDYDAILGVFMSSKLSGTYHSAVLAKSYFDFQKEKIFIIDSLSTIGGLKLLIHRILNMLQSGNDIDRVMLNIDNLKRKIRTVIIPNSLNELKIGGRLDTERTIAQNPLTIKPLVEIINGALEFKKVVRGKNRIYEEVLSKIPESVKDIIISHTDNIEDAKNMKDHICRNFKKANVSINNIGPVIGSHLGPKAITICWIE